MICSHWRSLDELCKHACWLWRLPKRKPVLMKAAYRQTLMAILLGRGRNRRVQDNDPSIHGETDAFRKAGRQTNYRDKILVTTLAPCWYCSGLIRQFNIGTVVVGESVNFEGHLDWLKDAGVDIVDMNDADCIALLRRFIEQSPQIWFEDIGECDCA